MNEREEKNIPTDVLENIKKTNQLLREFNLSKQNLDQGGGILYNLRYTSEKLEQMREQIISTLNTFNILAKEVGKNIEIVPESELNENDKEKLINLFEELSVINEALEYKEIGIDEVKNIFELKNLLILHYFALLKDREKVDAYNFVDIFIPQIIKDLSIAKEQGKKFSKEEEKAISELVEFAKRRVEEFNSQGFNMIG